MAWESVSARWKKAKKEFETLTGVKKPSPKGFFKSAFNTSGLTAAMSDADKAGEKLDKASATGKSKDVAAALKSGRSAYTKLCKASGSYLDVLEREAKSEQADKREKTTLYRGLKVLKAELEWIESALMQKIDQIETTYDERLTTSQKYAKQILAGLQKSCKSGLVSVKRVKADPTPATYNGEFYTTNSPGRQINVQLASAVRFAKQGLVPSVSVDPDTVKEMLAPWNAQNSEKARLDEDATRKQVLDTLGEFERALKFAVRYCADLEKVKP